MKRNLNFVLLIIICSLVAYSSCKKESDDPILPEPEVNEFESVDCDSFFDTGNYSDLCALNSASPSVIVFASPDDQEICSFVLSVDDSNEDNEYQVDITIRSSAEQAMVEMDGKVLAYSAIFPEFTSNSISGVDDNGHIVSATDSDQGVNHNYLLLQRSNALVVISSYWDFMDEPNEPCSHSQSEMLKLAENILDNL